MASFITITIRIKNREFHIDYTSLGILLLMMIISIPSFAVGYSMASAKVPDFLIESIYTKNDSAWKSLKIGDTPRASLSMSQALDFCSLLANYGIEGWYDWDMVMDVMRDCDVMKTESQELYSIVYPVDFKINNNTINFTGADRVWCDIKKSNQKNIVRRGEIDILC